MGQKSYSQKETEWEVEGRYPSVGSTDSTMRKRHLNWIFGRQKKNEKGEYVFPKDEARLVGEKIVSCGSFSFVHTLLFVD